MAQASSYEQWCHAARVYDEAVGNDRWRRLDQSRHFDYVSIRSRLDQLRALRARHDYSGLLFALNEGIHGNMGGMGKPELYQRAKFGTKKLIEDYVDEIVDALELLDSEHLEGVTREEKIDFFRRAHHCYGQSALMLSGSGMLAYFHVGVVKALWQQGLLPDIISGSSGGAFVGSMIATHTDEELKAIFNPQLLTEKVQSKGGVIEKLTPKVMRIDDLRAMTERLVPDMTFQEARDKTGRSVNVSIAPAEPHQTSRLLNAVTSPNVLIRESVLASSALPGVFPPVTLMARDKNGHRKAYLPSRKWLDGAISDDLPAKRLARLYGVNHFLVSQTNPHIIPFVSGVKRSRNKVTVLKTAATRTAREWVNASAVLMHGPLSKRPVLNKFANAALAIVNQDYIGDINILPPFRFSNPGRLLAALSAKEIEELILVGERATWPQIEMIRVQTKISRTLNRILREHDRGV